MKRRNRKKKHLDSFSFPTRLVGLVIVIVTVALMYLWLDYSGKCLGNEIKGLERRGELLKKRERSEMCKWAREKSPQNLAAALARHGIRMTWPTRRQIVHLRLPVRHDGHFAGLNRTLIEPPQVGEVVMND